MKVIIIHGWESSPDLNWLPWLKKELEAKGWQVTVPTMPEADNPKIEPWVSKLTEIAQDLDEETFLIGHSIGCQAILRFLENYKGQLVGGVLLVAPWMELDQKTIEEEGEEVVAMAKPWMETPIDFAKVKAQANKFTAIFSDDDPYVPINQQDLFAQKLKTEIIVEHNEGHFEGKEYPVILESLENL